MRLLEERKFVLRTMFVLTNLLAFLATLKAAVEAGELIEVIVRPFVEKRTNAANARLWKLHTLAGDFTGYSAEEMHELALCRHYGYTEKERVDPLTGEVELKRIPNERSSCQNKKKFGVFMEATEAWYISEFGVWLDQESMPAEPLRRAA